MMKKLLFSTRFKQFVAAVLLLTSGLANAQAPTITSFSPTSGEVGSSVTITGTGFDTTASNNVVLLDGMRCNISSASTTSLTVIIPKGATNNHFQVVNKTSGLSIISKLKYSVKSSTLGGGQVIPNSFVLNSPSSLNNIPVTNVKNYSTADIDNDGKLDILAMTNGYSLKVASTSSTPTNFNYTTNTITNSVLPVASNVRYAQLKDFNNDGLLDFMTTEPGTSTTGGWVNINTSTSGSPSFNPRISLTPSLTYNFLATDVVCADFNNDGKVDILGGYRTDLYFTYCKNTTTNGVFTESSTRGQGASQIDLVNAMAEGDFTGDGKIDYFVTHGSVANIVTNNTASGANSLSISVSTDINLNANILRTSDLDNDGDLDIVASNLSGTTIYILTNNGSGSFTITNLTITSGTGSINGIELGDLDGDGDVDIVYASTTGFYFIPNTSSSSNNISFNLSSNVTLATNVTNYGFKLVDLNEDNKFDILYSTGTALNILVNKIGELPTITIGYNTLSSISNCKTPRVIANHSQLSTNITLTKDDIIIVENGVPKFIYFNVADGNYYGNWIYAANQQTAINSTSAITLNDFLSVNPGAQVLAVNFPGSSFQVSSFNQALGQVQNTAYLPYYEEFTVSGQNLSSGLTVTPPANFQVSTNQSTWIGSTTTPTAITLTPSSGSVPSTTVYVRTTPNTAAGSYSGNITMASTGATSVTKAVAATLSAPTVISSQPTATVNVCQGASYTLGASATGSGSLSYQWYSNTTNSNTGGTSLGSSNFAQTGGLSIVTTTPGTFYYYLEVTGSCGKAVSNVTTIVISPTTVSGTASATSTTVCTGNTASLSLTGNTGTIQWQSSPNNSTWTNMVGATASSYITPALTSTTYYRALVTSGGCTAANSNVINVTVPTPPYPYDRAVNFASTGYLTRATTSSLGLSNFTVEAWIYPTSFNNYAGIIAKQDFQLMTATNGALAFMIERSWSWELRTTSTNILTLNQWQHVAASYNASTKQMKMYVNGVLVDTYTRTQSFVPDFTTANLTVGYNNGTGNGSPSRNFAGNIDEVKVWNTVKTDSEVAANYATQLAGNETGLVAYYKFDQGIGGSNNTTITSLTDLTSNSNHLTPSSMTMNGSTNNILQIGPAILSTPTICLNSSTTLTHTHTGGTWASSDTTVISIDPNTGVANANAVGTATITYTFTVSGCTYTSTKLFTVNGLPAISVQPASTTQSICINGSATALSVTATGAGLTYQWYKNTTAANTGGTLIAGATNSTYIPLTTTAGDSYYYCVVSGTCSPSVTSDVSGLIKINALSIAGTISSSVTSICDSGTATLSLAGNTGSVQWQRFDSPIWSDLNGETNTTYTTQTLTQNRIYRAVVTNGSCSSATSSEFTVQVNASPSAPTTPSTNIDYCKGATATAISATATSGYSLKWYTVATGGTASSTAPTPSTSTTGSTTYYVSQLQNSSTITTSTSAGTTASYVSGLNLGQTFQVATTSKVNSIAIGQIFAYSPIMTMKIYAGFGGTLLGTADATMTGSGYFNPVFTFANSNVILNANQTYYFEVTSSNSVSFYLMSVKSNYTTTGVLYQNNVANSALDYDFTITSTSIANPCESPRTAITVNVNELPTISGAQSMTVGGTTLQLTGSGNPAASNPWVSSAPSVAAISSTGVVTPYALGSTTITYTNDVGCSTTVTITVKDCAAPFSNALSFGNGTSAANADFVQINSRIFPSQSVNNFTIETWIKPAASDIITGTTGTTWLAFLGYSGSKRSPSLYITNNGVLHASWSEGSTLNGTPVSASSPTSLIADKWTHVALVKDGTTMRLYVNGTQITTVTCLATLDVPDNAYWIGKNDNEFDGTLDEVRFWSSARTQAEIRSTMNTELVGNETGLLAYFDFNQGIAGGTNSAITTVTNKANSALNGTLTNFTKTGTSSNFVGNTMSTFDIAGPASICATTTAQYTHQIPGGTWSVSSGASATVNASGLVTTSSNETITLTYAYTLNGCSKTATKLITIDSPAAPVASTTINLCQGATATALTATVTSGNTLQWYTTATGGTASTTAPTPSTNLTGTTTFYVSQKNNTTNCESTRTAITVNVNALPTITGIQNMTLGGTPLQLTGSGTPDATAPWASSNTGVVSISSTGEVTAVGAGSATITYTNSNGCSVTAIIIVKDCAVPFGNALNFDGANDYVVLDNVGTNTNLQFANTSSYTLEAWVKRNAATSNIGLIISKQNGGVAGNYSLGLSATGVPYLSREYTPWSVNANNSIPLNEWHHIAGVFDGSSLKIYIDGVLNNSVAASGSITPSTVTAIKVAIGAMYVNNTPSYFFNGTIDEVRVWNVARTAAQIQQTKNNSLNGNEPGLVAYYDFNQGIADGNNTSVNTIVNTVNSASNGTLTNFTKTGTTSNFVGSTIASFPISGITTVCTNSSTQYTHPIAGGTWSVSSGAAASVSISGVLSTAGAENLTLSYTYPLNGCSFTATKVITVQVPVISGTISVGAGETTNLTATTTPALSNAWVSSNTNVATVTPNGVVTGISVGTATVTFTNNNGCTDTKTITVNLGTTQVPVFTSPASNTSGAATLQISYTLPETPLAGSVRLMFTPVGGGTPIIWTMSNTTSVSFAYSVGTLPSNLNIVSGTALAFTTYNVTLSYQDAYGNPVAMVTNTNIQTLAPPSITIANNSYSGFVNTLLTTISINSTGGTVSSFTISPSLPAGLSFNTTTGAISGTPTAALANTIFTITATNPAGTATATFSLSIGADTDGDGVPDSVEVQQGTNPNLASSYLDSDGDGVPDYIEIQQGTNPNLASSYLDSDGDGVPNYIEIQQGTNPNVPGARDTDGDGVPDYIEVQQGTNPNVPGARDTDGDGVPDYIEVQQGTNPNVPGARDTDGDGVPDYIEVQQGTNPNVPGARDTDGDGVPDYIEIQQGTNPNVPGARDTDGDGVPDYIEIQQGSNPNISGDARDTDGDGLPDYYESNNIAPSNISITTNSISENNSIGAVVGNLTSTDLVDIYAHTYTLVSGVGATDNASFSILGNQLRAGIAFDFETKSSYSIRIKTTDAGGLSFEKVLTISILDVVENVAPTNIVLSTTSINENNSVNAVIGQLSSTDADTGDSHTYTLVSGLGSTDNASFSILGNQLRAGIAFDFETKSSYSIRIKTTDAGGLSFEKSFTISVINVNETPVLRISQSTNVGIVNVPLTTITVSNSGGPVTSFAIAPALSAGLLFNTTTGAISGTPTVAMASRTYTISGTNSDGTGTVTFNLFIDQDTDRDGLLDSIDTDDDGDGILDIYDAFPLNKNEWTDTDKDGVGNNADTDDDNDSILDSCDVDANGDGIPDNGTDLDGDGINDDCDTDKDGDGVINSRDNCPTSSNTDQADRDHDGLGDVCDTIEINASQAITPNGDGINDTWVIYNLGNHPGSIVRVFNANGTQVFYSANYQNNWMGNYQGSSEMLPVGSYLYQIDLGGDGSIDAQGWLYITK